MWDRYDFNIRFCCCHTFLCDDFRNKYTSIVIIIIYREIHDCRIRFMCVAREIIFNKNNNSMYFY